MSCIFLTCARSIPILICYNGSMKKEIPLSAPNLDMEIAENLRECVETGWVSTGGRFITEFEAKVARYVNAEEVVACQSGTAGLHTALRILGVGEGDEVIVPTLTFIAAVNPVMYQGAVPVFMDCDDSLCLDPVKLARFCGQACRLEGGRLIHKATGRHVKAVIPVHIFGNLSNMEAIMDIAAEYHLTVVEDATEAMGSFWKTGRYAGRHAGTAGHLGVFSFNANKIITTGGGGMILAADPDQIRQARYLTTTARDDGLFFVHDEVGYNYRMLNLQAALGVSQIDRLEDFIAIKKRNFARYREHLADLRGARLLPFPEDIRANHWFYALLFEDGDLRDRLMRQMIENGVQCRPVWKLVHTQKAYQNFRAYDIEKAPFYEKHILNIPCSTALTESQVDTVSRLIRTYMD